MGPHTIIISIVGKDFSSSRPSPLILLPVTNTAQEEEQAVPYSKYGHDCNACGKGGGGGGREGKEEDGANNDASSAHDLFSFVIIISTI